MTQHIGIVACSAEGAALCYRTIALEGAKLLGAHDHPEVSMHTHPLARYMTCIYANDWPGVAELMLSSAEKLAKAEADFLICPDNTIHQAFDLIEHRSPRPWLHIAQEVAIEARRSHFKRLGVLGTRYLMEGPVYPEKLKAAGLEHRIPGAQERQRINQIIMDELVNAQFPSLIFRKSSEPCRTKDAMRWSWDAPRFRCWSRPIPLRCQRSILRACWQEQLSRRPQAASKALEGRGGAYAEHGRSDPSRPGEAGLGLMARTT